MEGIGGGGLGMGGWGGGGAREVGCVGSGTVEEIIGLCPRELYSHAVTTLQRLGLFALFFLFSFVVVVVAVDDDDDDDDGFCFVVLFVCF